MTVLGRGVFVIVVVLVFVGFLVMVVLMVGYWQCWWDGGDSCCPGGKCDFGSRELQKFRF